MSGGSFDYIYCRVLEAADLTKDKEIAELLGDLAKLLHDEEWYESADYSEDQYLKTLSEFKRKWFKQDREIRLKGYIDAEIEKIKKDMYSLIGVD